MNLYLKPQRTPAEIALIEGFGARLSFLPGGGVVARRRDAAIERIKAGLPTRHVEAWHYTDLRRLLTRVPAHDAAAVANALPPLVEGSTVFSILNGTAGPSPAAIEGVDARRLDGMLADGNFASAPEARDDADLVGAINTAFTADGIVLDIAADAAIAGPIELQNIHAGGQAHARFAVSVGEKARVTIVERQTGQGEALVSSVASLTVGKGAEIVWIIVQEQPADATHLGQINAELGTGARLRLFVLNIGGKLVRQEIRVKAAGRGSEFTLRAVNLLSGDTHCDVTMVLDHIAEDTASSEIVRNVVTDRAHGVFQGQIRVDRLAQKTDAKMACNTLLLSDDAEFSTKPELEIFADDVACGHGATVTEIDRNHLFYLMARGVPENEARGLLIKAFVAEIVEELENEALVEAMEARLDAWFAQHG